jgi:hypothetical protein
MTIFELEDALVEFITANTSEMRFRSNEQTTELAQPRVYSGYVPRDEVGAINAGDISTYPAIIVSAQGGTQEELDGFDSVTVTLTVGCFDDSLDQQGYRDCVNLVQRLKDRFCEAGIIRERFPLYAPITWRLNPRGGAGATNVYPYFFAEMTVGFGLPISENQFNVTTGDGDVTVGRYNVPLLVPEAEVLAGGYASMFARWIGGGAPIVYRLTPQEIELLETLSKQKEVKIKLPAVMPGRPQVPWVLTVERDAQGRLIITATPELEETNESH